MYMHKQSVGVNIVDRNVMIVSLNFKGNAWLYQVSSVHCTGTVHA